MLYNTGHRFTKIIDPPSQEDIYNCKYYFGLNYNQVKVSGAPKFLIDLLDQFPLDGRNNFLQIRPQDFRVGMPYNVDGTHWHTDYGVRLVDSNGNQIKAYAKNHNEFHVMTISWGHGTLTDFIKTPMELPNNLEYNNTKERWEFWNNSLLNRLKEPFEFISAPMNQMSEYTSRDLHRNDGIIHSNGLRLLIIATDCDHIEGSVRIWPSIREIDNGAPIPNNER